MTGWKIGSATVTPVIELTLPVPGTLLIPQATPEALAPYADWLRPGYMTEQGQINLTIQAFLVESRGRKIIVDTCVGNGKTRPAPFNELDTPFLQHITDAGFPPEKVDTVICTHLHVDHVGWNTKKVDGRWVPTFPNARYVMARADYDHFEPGSRGGRRRRLRRLGAAGVRGGAGRPGRRFVPDHARDRAAADARSHSGSLQRDDLVLGRRGGGDHRRPHASPVAVHAPRVGLRVRPRRRHREADPARVPRALRLGRGARDRHALRSARRRPGSCRTAIDGKCRRTRAQRAGA